MNQEELEKFLNNYRSQILIFIFSLLVFNFLLWSQIFLQKLEQEKLRIYFLDVGQGDSELIILPSKRGKNVKILIDGGPANKKILEALDQVLSPMDRYFDLVILSHPQVDHFGGLIEVLKRYQIGYLIHNGRSNPHPQFEELKKVIRDYQIKTVRLMAGDRIFQADNFMEVLLPNQEFLFDKNLNNSSLVLLLKNKNIKVLFPGDIEEKAEKYLVNLYRNFNEKIDILKISHHGSKTASSEEFLKIFQPKLAFIEVGRNYYGHPSKEVLKRLENFGIKWFRTDLEGNLKVIVDGKEIKVIK